ncbi:tumor necrosis factor receptor superfamily member 6 [Pygocentrus nattereri]|uniref:tumor necrosis factor receptor superfamily member 6 n=1 Tax=Pygocentrus nattereri TaxID=42514 RepID=UPI00081453B9|nr:tumor necrosis factor receptor superfamily member 6 [Pygocentrus nattereri]
MLIQWCCVLLLTPILSRVQALACDEATQYEWPRNKPTVCCNKCLPGEYLKERCEQNQNTRCGACGEGYYMDRYNFEMTCRLCTDCAKENMKYNQTCTKTRDAECECKSGYKCSGERCESCVDDLAAKATTIITTPIKPPLPTETRNTAVTKNKPTFAPDKDNVWISLSLSCACVCILLICFILISRRTPACGWALSSSTVCCFWTAEKSSVESSQCTEEEEVPMPVQEVCGGKTEWQEEV